MHISMLTLSVNRDLFSQKTKAFDVKRKPGSGGEEILRVTGLDWSWRELISPE